MRAGERREQRTLRLVRHGELRSDGIPKGMRCRVGARSGGSIARVIRERVGEDVVPAAQLVVELLGKADDAGDRLEGDAGGEGAAELRIRHVAQAIYRPIGDACHHRS